MNNEQVKIFSPTSYVDDVFFDMTHYSLTGDVKEHTHNCIEIVTIVEGHCQHSFNGITSKCLAGNVFIVLPENTHGFTGCQGLQLYNISCTPDVIDTFGIDSSFWHACRNAFRKGKHNISLSFTGREFYDLHKLMDAMFEEYSSSGPQRQLHLRSFFSLFFMMLSRKFAEATPSPEEQYPMEKIAEYIEKNYRSGIQLDKLARLASLSKSQLIRRFQTEFKTTPIAYLLDYRIRQAAEILKNTHKSIEETAFACGFNDCNYFIKQFKKRYGTSPGRYRNI